MLVQQEAGSDGGWPGGSSAGDPRLAQLEQQNSQLAARLETLQAGAGRHQEGVAGAVGELAELQQVSMKMGRLVGGVFGQQ